MPDNRTRNNLSVAKRRSIVAGTRRKSKRRADAGVLDHAKNVLRRRGMTVFDADISDPRFAGSIYVDARRRTAVEVIEMARDIEEGEARRNAEVRAEHGLANKK